MSTLGKVLAVLNVLGAIGFLVVAGMDYQKRQSWAYSHFEHQVQVNGLPLDDKDDTWRLPGRTISAQFGKDARQKFLGDANAPKTQADNVKATVTSFENVVKAAADIPAKKAAIAEHLLPELATAEERDQVIHELQTVKDEAGVTALMERFNKIVEQTTKGDRESRRRAIADFLYNFQYTDDYHKRVMGVIGLEQYVAAAERQTVRLHDIVHRDLQQIARQQAAFVTAYQSIPPELTVLADQLQSLEAKLTDQKSLVQKHTALKNARMAEAMNLNNQLNDQKAAAARELATLNAIQRELFAVQQDVAAAQERNQKLERDLRAKETAQ
jgi:hypothetical protein